MLVTDHRVCGLILSALKYIAEQDTEPETSHPTSQTILVTISPDISDV